jgi:hypothetical protein
MSTHEDVLSAETIAQGLIAEGVAKTSANQYAKAMIKDGFDTATALQHVEDDDLDGYKMKTGHKRVLKQIIATGGFDSVAAAAPPAKKAKSTRIKIDGKKSGGGVKRHVKTVKHGRVVLDQGIHNTIIKSKSTIVAHDGSKFADAHVLEEGEDIWDAVLNQTNISGNNNKFYNIQLLESGGKFYCWQRWGRVGDMPRADRMNCVVGSLESAKSVFSAKFKAKTKNNWDSLLPSKGGDRDDFLPVSGKYTLIAVNYNRDESGSDNDDGDNEVGEDGDDEDEVLQWQDENDKWQNYLPAVADLATTAKAAGEGTFSFTVSRNGQHYTVNFGQLTQTNDQFGTSKPVRWVKASDVEGANDGAGGAGGGTGGTGKSNGKSKGKGKSGSSKGAKGKGTGTHPDSALPEQVQSLIATICDVRAMEEAMLEIGYDAAAMPLGQLSEKQINKGFGVLKKVVECLRAGSKSMRKELNELSSLFYTYIPHDFGMARMSQFVLDSEEDVTDKVEMLKQLGDVSLATKILSAKREFDEHPIDSKYRQLKVIVQSLVLHTHTLHTVCRCRSCNH